jgi:hypothetical protein
MKGKNFFIDGVHGCLIFLFKQKIYQCGIDHNYFGFYLQRIEMIFVNKFSYLLSDSSIKFTVRGTPTFEPSTDELRQLSSRHLSQKHLSPIRLKHRGSNVESSTVVPPFFILIYLHGTIFQYPKRSFIKICGQKNV